MQAGLDRERTAIVEKGKTDLPDTTLPDARASGEVYHPGVCISALNFEV
jgi:hypothetical protein